MSYLQNKFDIKVYRNSRMEPNQNSHIRWDEYATRWLQDHIGYILLIIYMLLLCIAIPLTIHELYERHAEVSY